MEMLSVGASSDLGCSNSSCGIHEALALSDRLWNEGRLHASITVTERAALRPGGSADSSCAVAAALLAAVRLARVRCVSRARGVLDEIRPVTERSKRDGHDGQDRRDDVLAALSLAEGYVSAAAGAARSAVELAEAGLRRASRAGLTSWTPLGHVTLATAALRAADLPAALAFTAELMEDAIFERAMSPAGESTWAIVQVVQADKGREQATTLGAELIASDRALRQLLSAEPAAAAWLVRLMTDMGRWEAAERCLREAKRVSADNGSFRSLHAAALHAAGVYHEDAAHLRRAANEHVDPWARASALEDLGTLLARQAGGGPEGGPGGHKESEQLLERSAALYAKTEATRDALRVRQRARSAGTDPAPNHPIAVTGAAASDHGRTPGAAIALTDIEYAVARLVAQGLTNAQAASQLFLSHHTIAFHLRKIFRKLGVRSRVQLAATWHTLHATETADQSKPISSTTPSPAQSR